MGRAEVGRVREEKRREEMRWEMRREEKRRRKNIKKEKAQKKEDPGARKVGSCETLCFSNDLWLWRVENVCSLKRGASWPDERWKIARRCGAKHICKSKCTKHLSFGPLLEVAMSKKCTPLWRQSTFRSQKCNKLTGVRSTFGSWDVQKGARRCGAKHIWKSKWTKHTRSGPLLEIEMSKKCTPLWREAHFEVKMWKAQGVRTTFGRSDVVSRGRRKGLVHLLKSEQNAGLVAFPKTMAARGTFEEDLQRCIFPGRRSTRDMLVRDVRRSGRWFPERGCIFGASDLQVCWDDFAWQMQHFVWPGIDVLGVDAAVKGPCAVFIFFGFCVPSGHCLCQPVWGGGWGGGGWGGC